MQEIRIYKADALLERHVDGQLALRVTAQMGRNLHDKVMEGDEATPLGEFFVCAKNLQSRFHRSLCLSYPNVAHAERGLAQNLISQAEFATILDALAAGRMPLQQTRLGGEIYIHGHADAAHPVERDWTRGCIAVDNVAMRSLYDLAVIGTPVRITQ